MGFIKGALFGIAVYAAVQHITKKDILTGRSLLDDLMDRAPACILFVIALSETAQLLFNSVQVKGY